MKSYHEMMTMAAATLMLALATVDAQEEEEGESSTDMIFRLSGIVALVMLSGLFSGLTLGLMSLDKIGLEIVIGAAEAEHATESEKQQAQFAQLIAPIRKNGNLLLTTLLLGNVAVNALLSILLADLTSGTVGFIVSTAVIVTFGEIIPQAVCSRHALLIGSKCVPVVRVIIALLYVLAKPISWVLDHWLGEEIGTIHSKRELLKMLDIYVKKQALDVEEGEIMLGAMSYKNKEAGEIMTPIENVYMLPVSSKLDFKLIREIFESGFSRIPVMGKDKNDIVGLLFVKDLIFIDPEDATPLLNFIHIFGRGVHKVWPDSKLGDVLKLFKMGRGHLALVQDVNNTGPGDPFYEVQGLVTLEDILEEILQDEIVDETDVFVEVEKLNRVNRRTFDYARLRLLDNRLVDEHLSADEIQAIATYLITNHPHQFRQKNSRGEVITEQEICTLIEKCPVLEIDPVQDTDPLYARGVVASHCTLLLSGKVSIAAGRDGFETEIRPWSVLAAECLITPEGSYIPDFTATAAGTKSIRCVQIPRVEFQQMLYPIHLPGAGTSELAKTSVLPQ